ncbi:MAG: hypothetical protein V4525_09705 [Pseudomonadota bacterium]
MIPVHVKGSSRSSFSLRLGACFLLLILPLFFPHSPWKPEETRVIGILIEHIYPDDVIKQAGLYANTFYFNIISKLFTLSHKHWSLEGISRSVSVAAMVLGAFALYGWALAIHKRYPVLIPKNITSAAPLLLASSVGLMVRGYQATPESIWFTGIAMSVWAGAETVRIKRICLLIISFSWLWACNGVWGGLLALVCGGLIPWLFRWHNEAQSNKDRIEGAVLTLLTLSIIFSFSFIKYSLYQQRISLDVTVTYLKEIARVLVWYALPIWPLLIAVWWRGRYLSGEFAKEWHCWRWEPVLQALATLLIGIKVGGLDWQESHIMMYLPFLVMMALPSLYLVDARSWFNAVHWFTRSVLILMLLAVWGAVSALHWKMPYLVYNRLETFQPGFDPSTISEVAWMLSMILTGYALRYLIVPCKTLRDSLWRWTLGFGCTACVIRLMLVPYIDYGRSYRAVMLSLQAALPKTSEVCVTVAPSVGYSQAAMWRYYTQGLIANRSGCKWRLLQGRHEHLAKQDQYNIEKDLFFIWKEDARASRPGDNHHEIFFLMHREPRH